LPQNKVKTLCYEIKGEHYVYFGIWVFNDTVGGAMKVFYYLVFVLILIIGACSLDTEESSSTTTTTVYGDGSASSPVDLTDGTAKEGSVAKSGYSYYKFTPASGSGSYKLAIASLSITDSGSSSSSVTTYLYSDSGYSSELDNESCQASCTLNFNYAGLDNGSTYYLKIYGYDGEGTYSLTVSQGGSEGSVNNPVALTLSTIHSGKVEGTSALGKSYYKFTTAGGESNNYTLTMTNSDSMDCDLYSDIGFSTLVSATYNSCTAGTRLSATFRGSGSGLTGGTTYYLRIEGQSSTAKASTYNITVAPAS